MNKRTLLATATFSLGLAHCNVQAYEEEAASPLTITVHNEHGNIDKVTIRLIDNQVQITTPMVNRENEARRIGFAAHTGFFNAPEIAEDNREKDFPSLKALINGKPAAVSTSRRGFILGNDITAQLQAARINPLPDVDARIGKRTWRGLPMDAWQGFASHTWIATLPPRSESLQTITYRALPQFGRDEPGSERFARMVAQHCGTVGDARKYTTAKVPGLEYLMFDRYEIPVTFLRSREVQLEVSQRAHAKAGKRPMLALACGVRDVKGEGANWVANIADPDNTISILVISAFDGSVSERKAQ
jgi:hypothetical protein